MKSPKYPETSLILDEIQKAKSILLHCHPSPDEDSIGGALATFHLLKKLGKNVSIIAGDSEIPTGFELLPDGDEILPQNITEIDLGQFDLFISQW